MSFFNSFRRALGIGDEYSEDEYQEIEQLDDANAAQASITERKTVTEPTHESDEALSCDILEAVVSLFNSIQPDFISKCIDTDEQKKYLFNSLDEGLKKRIKKAVEEGYREGLKLWEDEKRKLSDEVEKLKAEKADFIQKRDETKSALLSAERQKRALTERVRDLENQNAKVEAEIEQLNLENRSLMNKIRVAGVNSNTSGEDNKAAAELSRLRQDYDNLTKAAEEEKTKMSKEIARLLEDIERQKELLAQAKNFTTDMTERDQKIASLSETIEDNASELNKLQIENANLSEQLVNANKKISELESDLETASFIKNQVDKIEKSLVKKEEQIEQVKKENNLHRERIVELESTVNEKDGELSQLRKELERTKEINLKNLESLKALEKTKGEQIESTLSDEKEQKIITAETNQLEIEQNRSRHRHKRRKKKDLHKPVDEQPKSAPVISAIDDLLDSNDWFVAPDVSEFVKEPSEPEDFGYKPPQRKTNEEIDDNQLSLW